MRRVLLAATAVSVLAACSQERAEVPSTVSETATATAEAPARERAAATDAATSSAEVAAPPEPGETPEPPQLAYSHRFSLETPEDRVTGLMRRHERACIVAGAQICQLMGAEVSTDADNDRVSGELRLRAVPAWVEDFRDRLEADAAEAEGRMVQTSTGADDVTRNIGDAQANVARLNGERDRLRRELAAFRGPIQDRLEIERELAGIESELDTGGRDLRGEQARVTMSTVQVSYRAEEAAISRGTFGPVASAANDFTATLMMALGALIRVVSVLLVPGLAIGAVWGGVRWLRRRRRAAAAPVAKTSAAQAG